MNLRLLIATAVTACLPVAPAAAQTIAEHTCNGSYAALSNTDKNRIDYKSFVANCEQNRESWERPPSDTLDPNLSHVTGLCADNSYTTALIQSEACTHDGGVSAWFASPPPQQVSPACDGAACAPSPSLQQPPSSPPARKEPQPTERPTSPVS